MLDRSPPPLRFSSRVRAALNARDPNLADRTQERLREHVRPRVLIRSERVSSHPLRQGSWARLLGRTAAPPLLPVATSKLAGTPYCENDEPWDEHVFVGQVDLDAATSVLPEGVPRLRGLLRVDLHAGALDPATMLRVRWFPEVDPHRPVTTAPHTAGKWETRLHFELGWALPEGDALDALWPGGEAPQYDGDLFPTGYNDAPEHVHTLLGHRSCALDGDLLPSIAIEDYESLLHLDVDPRADLSWGPHGVFVLVPREDLARGDLTRVAGVVCQGG